MNKPVIIIGDGGHASVLVETLLIQQREIIGYTAPSKEKEFFDLPYLGTDDMIADNYNPNEVELVLGLGTVTTSNVGKSIFLHFKSLAFSFANVIHPTAIISPTTQIGEGAQIMAGTILQANVSIEDNTIINTGSIIDHDCLIGKHAHIAPGSTLSGGVQIGDGCHIGVGTSIIQGITIGHETTIGAGSVVVKDIGSGKTAYGVPAKEV